MPNIRTNLLRIQISTKCLIYEVDISSKIPLDANHHSQVASFINNNMVNVLYAYPHVYTRIALTELSYTLFLSNGAPLLLQLNKQGEGNSQDLMELIATKLMTLTQLLSCFNPFQEKRKDDHREIPGFTITTNSKKESPNLFIVPLVLCFNIKEDISQQSQVLLDYYSGNFCLKQNIVRIDKSRGEVHFRNGNIIKRSGLKSITIKPIGGYPLAHQLYNFFNRIKDSSNSFCQCWGIKFDSRFLQSQIVPVIPGVISFRNGYERSLSQIITPMSQHNWTHNFIEFFNGGCFDDPLQAEIVFIPAQNQRKYMVQLGKRIEAVRFRMGFNLNYKTVPHKGFDNIEELLNIIRTENAIYNPLKIYILPHNRIKTKIEKDNYQKLIQIFIEHNILFHLVEINSQKEYNFQVQAYKHLCILYTKFRLNPWKIKNIPFSNAPMSVMTLHVQLNRQGLMSVALVSTMNLFLTKFTAVYKVCKPQSLKITIQQAIKQCIGKFQSAHNRSPTRIFIFRTGVWQKDQEAMIDQHKYIKDSIYLQTNSLITYVSLSKIHSLRSFSQLDSNYVARDSCKRVQNLIFTTIKDQIYFQLQLQEPMHRINIYDIQKNDPNFIPKILQLASKVIFGGVGNQFGKGLGFIDYSRKLNQFRDYNLQNWKGMLRDGILTYL